MGYIFERILIFYKVVLKILRLENLNCFDVCIHKNSMMTILWCLIDCYLLQYKIIYVRWYSDNLCLKSNFVNALHANIPLVVSSFVIITIYSYNHLQIHLPW